MMEPPFNEGPPVLSSVSRSDRSWLELNQYALLGKMTS
jgi:hypothetical protein